jgi:hypothetical protein
VASESSLVMALPRLSHLHAVIECSAATTTLFQSIKLIKLSSHYQEKSLIVIGCRGGPIIQGVGRACHSTIQLQVMGLRRILNMMIVMMLILNSCLNA